MKEMMFSKDEFQFIQECLQNEINNLCLGFHAQDMETTNKNAKRKKECERLIKKFQRAEKTIKVSSRKGKGRNFQYWICDRIAGLFGIKFVQADNDCLIHSREMGQHGTDIIMRGKVKKLFPFSVECKCCESLNIPAWIEQANQNTEEDKDWLLAIKKQSIGKPIVIMEWESFEKMMKKYLS